jgi:hypothetical protein
MKATAINILAMVGLIAFMFLAGCSDGGRPLLHSELKQQAEAAIRDAGGVDALAKEAKFVLSNVQGRADWETNCPAVTQLDSILTPDKRDSWLRADQEMLRALPAHVVVRFGSHAHYAHVWIFDPAHVPIEKVEGVEHLGGAVFLSEKNL